MLQPTGLAVLDQLKLAGSAMAKGARIDRLYGKNASGKTVLDARYADLNVPGAFGLGIRRASLFDVLYDAVCIAGIQVETSCLVKGTWASPHGRMLDFADGRRSGPFDLVIDALGIHSTLAPTAGHWLNYGALWASLALPDGVGFASDRLEQRYRAARQMVGVLPTGVDIGADSAQVSFFWSLRADHLDGWHQSGLRSWKEDVLALWPQCAPLLDQITDPAQLTFARYAHHTNAKPVGDHIIHIGDAWHSASPQLGQGANMALLDAWSVAEGLRLGGDVQTGIAIAATLREFHIKLYQHITGLFTPLYQSDQRWPPLMRDWLLAPVSRIWPARSIQSALVGGLIGSPLKRLGLAMPNYRLLAKAG